MRCVGAVRSCLRYLTSLLLPASLRRCACAGDRLGERKKPDIQSCLIFICPLQHLSHLRWHVKQLKPGLRRRTGRKLKTLFPSHRSHAAVVPLPPILQLRVPAASLEPAAMFDACWFREQSQQKTDVKKKGQISAGLAEQAPVGGQPI